MSEAAAFLAKYPDVEAIDIILTDFHGIGRGKMIRRHELEGIYKSGRGLPTSIFGQDVTGEDVDDCGLVQTGGGGDGPDRNQRHPRP
jgi:glutamine synthetase